ncbi:MAG: RNA polymerase sigma factor [Pseudomonadota bacterium]
MNEHAGILHKVARGYAPGPADREDLLQEILFAVWRSIPSFRGDSQPSTYLYRIALNRAIALQRADASRGGREDSMALDAAHLVATADEPDERLECVYAELRKLDEVSRAAVLLQLDGYRYEEIAELLGLSASNVGVRLSRARKTLINNLRER